MESSDSVTADTPGARLRAAREALGISPREMADRLNWIPAHVSVIEEDRFDELRGAAFVRGYLRAYAKAVNLDEDEIVAGYAAMFPQQKETPAPVASSIAVSGQKTGWSVLFGIVVSVIIIAGIWWKQQTPTPAKPTVQAQESPARQAASAATTAAEVDGAPEPSRPDTSAGLASAARAVPAEAAAGAADGTVDDSSAEPAPAPVADTGAAAVTAAEPESPSAGEDLLELEFTEDCWLEVRDGDDQLIYADLRGPGDRLSLQGKAPFRILAGNAAALTLRFRGEPVEVVTRPGRDSARFTVGEP